MKNKIGLLLIVLACVFGFTACLTEEPNWADGQPSPIIALIDLRFLHRGTADVSLTPDNLTGAHQVVGVVISDGASGNAPNGNLVIQNRRRGGLRGIVIDVPATGFAPGDSVVVDINGATLVNINGALRLKGVTPAGVKKVGTSKILTNPVSVSQLKANAEAYEGTLIKIAGSVNPTPISGETYSGDKILVEGSDKLILHTEPNAALATRRLPASASFTGIFVRNAANAEAAGQIWVRNAGDIENASGPMYANWPENFDALPSATKSSYNMNTAAVPNNEINLKTGRWRLHQAILGDIANDRVVSAPNAIRFQQELSEPGYLEMRFDVPNGATKVTAWVSSYAASTDKPAKWRLEFSKNQGTTWTQIGEDQMAISKNKELITFLMDVRGPVRFRIYKYGPGSSATNATIQNGRLSVDDFAIYENPQ